MIANKAKGLGGYDYYPFGMEMPGRKYSNGSGYRYGFNGKENDKDAGEGIQDYGMRIYDRRIGKFLSVDPITANYPELTPYQFASNTPILAIDQDGLEAYAPGPEAAAYNFFVWLFSDDEDDAISGMDNIYDGVQKQVTTQRDIRVYDQISHEKNPEVSISEYEGVKRMDGKLQAAAGTVQTSMAMVNIAGKVDAIATLGVSAPSLINSGQRLIGKLVLTVETKLTVKIKIQVPHVEIKIPEEFKIVNNDEIAPVVKNRNSNNATGNNVLYDVHADGPKKGELLKIGKANGDDLNAAGRPKRMRVSERKARAAGYPNATATIRKKLGTTTTKQATDLEAGEVVKERAKGNPLPLNREKGKKYKG